MKNISGGDGDEPDADGDGLADVAVAAHTGGGGARPSWRPGVTRPPPTTILRGPVSSASS